MATTATSGGPVQVDDEHRIRITSHGKLKTWVSFALGFFDKNPDRPLVFHTLPAVKTGAKEKDPEASEDTPVDTKTRRVSPSCSTIPRLISVVEIVKREYLKNLPTTSESRLHGLHQYNKIGYIQDSNDDGNAALPEEMPSISDALMGKNHPVQRQTPYMTITLCTKALAHLEGQSVTYQPPAVRRVSKMARLRAKKREKKAMSEADSEPSSS